MYDIRIKTPDHLYDLWYAANDAYLDNDQALGGIREKQFDAALDAFWASYPALDEISIEVSGLLNNEGRFMYLTVNNVKDALVIKMALAEYLELEEK